MIPEAMLAGSASHRKPLSPCVTPSAEQLPRTSRAGVPMAAASRTTMGALSYTEGKTSRSARR